MTIRTGKWTAEIAQRRLSAEMGARCVRSIGSSMDRSNDPWETYLHGHLTGEGSFVGR